MSKISEKFFLIPMVVLSFGASVSFAAQGKYKLALYWLLIAGINTVAATF